MRKVKWLGILLCALLLFSLTGVSALAADSNSGKGPPQLVKGVVVHYAEGKGWGPGGNPNKGGGGDDDGGKLWYKYSGIHWDSDVAAQGIPYYIDVTNIPDTYLSVADAKAGIRAGFKTWDDVSDANINFNYVKNTNVGISSLTNATDGFNVVGWADISDDYPRAIAVTMYWYIPAYDNEVVEIDMALNSDSTSFAWHQNSVSGDPDKARWTGIKTGLYDVDVQNIVTHEAGHWIVLGDLYNKPASKETMYGVSAEFELKKRSLESGDIAGIQSVYP